MVHLSPCLWEKEREFDEPPIQPKFIVLLPLLHQRFGLGAEILPRGVARIEHVPARIHDKLHTIGRSIGRQLIEQKLRTEIGRRKIEQYMPDKQLQLGIERENLPELGGRFQRIEAAAEVP